LIATPAPSSGRQASGWSVAHVNPVAAAVLGHSPETLPRHRLDQFLPADTAEALTDLCERAGAGGRPAERTALAPDPLTDLAGAPTVTVRAVPLGDAVFCTWASDWPAADARGGSSFPGQRPTMADRIALNHALDLLGAQGIGVFTANLITGRTVWSAGLYAIFGRAAEDGPITGPAIWAQFAAEGATRTGWRALVGDGSPLDLDVRLVARLGGARLRISARVTSWAGGLPATIHGACRVIDD
jgi:hypothetical protein